MITLTLLLFSLFSVFEGVREAQYFHFRWKHPMEYVKDEHLPFTLLRSIVAIYATVIPILLAKWYAVFTIICFASVFPFFHDGAYYWTRHKLDKTVYNKKWMDQTTSSSAKISLSPWIRLGLMIFGYVIAIGLDILFTWANVWFFLG